MVILLVASLERKIARLLAQMDALWDEAKMEERDAANAAERNEA